MAATHQFAAEVLFLSPAHVAKAQVALAAKGLTCEIDPDLVDPHTDYVWTMVSGETELEDEDDIGNWLIHIVSPFEGDVIEWGFGPGWKIRA
jgi:hypothetical protein